MKIELKPDMPMLKMWDDDGNDITDKMKVRCLTIEADTKNGLTAIIELVCVNIAEVVDVNPVYDVAGRKAIGIIQPDGTEYFFPGARRREGIK